MRRVVQEELGAPPEQLFASFDPEPIASASLAQVHRATRRGTGEPLAVKVQHAGMLDACAADLRAVSLAVGLAEWLFPDEFRLGWVLAELVPHLPLELDGEPARLSALDRADHRRQEGQRLLLQGGLHPLQVVRDGAEERLEG